jgi:CDP-glycerol glycerophosphotransferase (TagB/SpsB family)
MYSPFGTTEGLYLLHARALNIPVACQLLSWDNITTKGTPATMPDYFISWGPVMSKELIEWYRFPKERIYECGVPHFDVYSQPERLTPRSQLLHELKLPPDEPYIFWGTVTWLYCQNEFELLGWLAAQINEQRFVRPCSLVIRPHPQTLSGEYSRGETEQLRALIGPRVAVDLPRVQSDKLAWDLPRSDMYRLASLLAGSAMCINANSTLCLDASMLDRPVISVAFDGRRDLPYYYSSRRVIDYIHMAKLISFGGIRVATSFDELERRINAYLVDPSLDHQGRMKSVREECGPRDGGAGKRVANTLFNLAARFAKSNQYSTADRV